MATGGDARGRVAAKRDRCRERGAALEGGVRWPKGVEAEGGGGASN